MSADVGPGLKFDRGRSPEIEFVTPATPRRFQDGDARPNELQLPVGEIERRDTALRARGGIHGEEGLQVADPAPNLRLDTLDQTFSLQHFADVVVRTPRSRRARMAARRGDFLYTIRILAGGDSSPERMSQTHDGFDGVVNTIVRQRAFFRHIERCAVTVRPTYFHAIDSRTFYDRYRDHLPDRLHHELRVE